ncbi:hypothetical protein [Pseudorhizobium flavum]|uniref:hypothetical protein n=1 Tax=Pseudorhizobium flavum TaxID=1335061 RepID=UPI00376F4D4B
MRQYGFEIAGDTWIVSEGEDVKLNGQKMTVWEVRKDLGDAYHQYASAYIPRRATIAQIKAQIAEEYVYGNNGDGDYWAA